MAVDHPAPPRAPGAVPAAGIVRGYQTAQSRRWRWRGGTAGSGFAGHPRHSAIQGLTAFGAFSFRQFGRTIVFLFFRQLGRTMVFLSFRQLGRTMSVLALLQLGRTISVVPVADGSLACAGGTAAVRPVMVSIIAALAERLGFFMGGLPGNGRRRVVRWNKVYAGRVQWPNVGSGK